MKARRAVPDRLMRPEGERGQFSQRWPAGVARRRIARRIAGLGATIASKECGLRAAFVSSEGTLLLSVRHVRLCVQVHLILQGRLSFLTLVLSMAVLERAGAASPIPSLATILSISEEPRSQFPDEIALHGFLAYGGDAFIDFGSRKVHLLEMLYFGAHLPRGQ
jgi:hypothetical protein